MNRLKLKCYDKEVGANNSYLKSFESPKQGEKRSFMPRKTKRPINFTTIQHFFFQFDDYAFPAKRSTSVTSSLDRRAGPFSSIESGDFEATLES